MARELVVEARKCIGCCQCGLICSYTYHNEFNPSKAYVQLIKHELSGLFNIVISSECKYCKKCAIACPTGALRVIDIPGKQGG